MNNPLKHLLLIVCLLFCASINAQTQSTAWNYIHKVKKQETIFGIAKDYGITIEQLLDANPDMKQPGYQLQKGTWVFVPYEKKGDKEAADKKEGRAMLQQQQARPVRTNVIKVGVMLPIHLDNSEGERMVEYYQGLRLALDSLTKKNINVELSTWNLAKDSSVVKVISDPRAYALDLIIGPLYSAQLPQLSQFCKTNGIRLFVPFSIEGGDLDYNPQVMQVYQTPAQLNERTVKACIERIQFYKAQPVIIDCNNPGDGKVAFTSALRQQLTATGFAPKLTNLNTPMADFAKQFAKNRNNIVVLNTARSPELNAVIAKLDSLTKADPSVKVTLFGYNEWFMYQKYDLTKFYQYNVFIPTTYYYNAASARTEAFERDFEAHWGQKMMSQWTPRMGLVGYDHMMFLGQGIHKYDKDFTGVEGQSDYRAIQSPLEFKQTAAGGGYQNDNFQLIHFRTDKKMESLTY